MKKYQSFILIITLFSIFFLIDILGLILTPPNYFYYIPDPDINVYYTYMDQAREGSFWFCNQFDVMEHDCNLFFPLWYLAGRLGNLFDISNLTSFILIRAMSMVFLFLVLFQFCKKLFNQNALFVFLLGIFSGGVFMVHWQSSIFLAILRNPLNIVVYSIFILLIWLIIKVVEDKLSFIKIISLIGLNWLLVMLHPYEALILIINYGIFILVNSFYSYKYFIKSIVVFLSSMVGIALSLLFYLIIFFKNSAYSDWLKNNFLPIDNILTIITVFGLLLPLSLLGAYLIFISKLQFKKWAVILSGLFGGWVSIFLPLYVNNKLLLSWYLGLYFTSAYLIIYILNKKVFRKSRMFLITILVLFLISGNIIYFGNTIYKLVVKQYPMYLPKDYILPLNWLRENSSLNESILASEKWKTFLAGYSGVRTFIGSNQIFQPNKKKKLVDWFYRDNFQNQEKQEFLKTYDIEYVYYSPFEKEKGSYDPSIKKYLEKIYDDGWAQIYKVIPQVL